MAPKKLRYNSEFVAFQLSEKLGAVVREMCEKEGITRSKWMRRAVRRELHRLRRTKLFKEEKYNGGKKMGLGRS